MHRRPSPLTVPLHLVVTAMRLVTLCVLVLAAPVSMAEGAELKPKFGDIDGVYYTDIAGDREACR